MEHLNKSLSTSFPADDGSGRGYAGARDGIAGCGYSSSRSYVPQGGGRSGRGRDGTSAGARRGTRAGVEESIKGKGPDPSTAYFVEEINIESNSESYFQESKNQLID